MARAVLTPRARNDLLEAVRWIAKENKIAARGLRDAVRAAAEQVGRHAEIGSLRPGLASEPIRFLPLTGYPHVLVYDPRNGSLIILRLLHGARDLPDLLSAHRNSRSK